MKPFKLFSVDLIRYLGMAVLLLLPSRVYAIPLSLTVTIDELTRGRFVFSGNIDDSFTPGINSRLYKTSGLNWSADLEINKDLLPKRIGEDVIFVTDYDIIVKGRHDTRDDPPPHKGETKQGLLLGDNHEVIHLHILGSHAAVFKPGPQDQSTSLIHPGSIDHFDKLSSHMDDLNGASPGFATAGHQISERIDLAHTPEPITFWLIGGGLVSLAALKRKRTLR